MRSAECRSIAARRHTVRDARICTCKRTSAAARLRARGAPGARAPARAPRACRNRGTLPCGACRAAFDPRARGCHRSKCGCEGARGVGACSAFAHTGGAKPATPSVCHAGCDRFAGQPPARSAALLFALRARGRYHCVWRRRGRAERPRSARLRVRGGRHRRTSDFVPNGRLARLCNSRAHVI